MGSITTNDGTQISYKDWGSGRPIVFSHGWPLSSDAWEDAMFFLASAGYRCIAADRRGHGRSSQPWSGNDLDTYADDLATLTEQLNLTDAIHVGHSTGGGEVARYIGRHGSKRVAGAVLVADITPLMLKTPANTSKILRARSTARIVLVLRCRPVFASSSCRSHSWPGFRHVTSASRRSPKRI
jgi:non-heme chloroperoxidase